MLKTKIRMQNQQVNHHQRFSKKDLILIIFRIFILLFQIFGIILMIFLFNSEICNEKCKDLNYKNLCLFPFYSIMLAGAIISIISLINELVYYYFIRKKSIVCSVLIFSNIYVIIKFKNYFRNISLFWLFQLLVTLFV